MVLVPLWLNVPYPRRIYGPDPPQGVTGGKLVAIDRKLAIYRTEVPIDLQPGDLAGEVEPEARQKTKTVRKALNDLNGIDCCCDQGGGDQCDSVTDECDPDQLDTSVWYRCDSDCVVQGRSSSCDPDPAWDLPTIRGTRCCGLDCLGNEINLSVTSLSSGRGFSFTNAALKYTNDSVIHSGNSFRIFYTICDAGTVDGFEVHDIVITVSVNLFALDEDGGVFGACPSNYDFPCNITPSFSPSNPEQPGPWAMDVTVTYVYTIRNNALLILQTDGCCEARGGEIVEQVVGSHSVSDGQGITVPSFDWNRIASDEFRDWFQDMGETLLLSWGSAENVGITTERQWFGPGCRSTCPNCP